MKRLLFVSLTISCAFFILNNCTDSSNPTITNTEHTHKLQKPKKPKPPENDTRIEYFKLGGIELIADNEDPDPDASLHEVLDISEDVNISYHITSTIDIDKIKVEMRYDADANSERGEYSYLEWDTEMIYPDPYYDEVKFDVVVNEPIQISLFDQLASYHYPDGKEPPLDHYIIYISVFNTDGTPITLLVKKAFVWITGAEYRSDKRLVVQDIPDIEFLTNKNKVTPKVTLQLAQLDEGLTPTIINLDDSIQIFGTWEGLVSGNVLNWNAAYSDEDGIITIEGDSFRKNSSGFVRFIVTNIKSKTGVYDPLNNKLGDWPTSRPSYEDEYP